MQPGSVSSLLWPYIEGAGANGILEQKCQSLGLEVGVTTSLEMGAGGQLCLVLTLSAPCLSVALGLAELWSGKLQGERVLGMAWVINIGECL